MSSTIDQYREAKVTYQRLHNQAKKELVARFNQLAGELLLIQKELRDDFGYKVALPVKGKGSRGVRASSQKETAAPSIPIGAISKKANPKVAVLERRLTAEKGKLEKAAAAGKPEKIIRDRIYELEDELRLTRES